MNITKEEIRQVLGALHADPHTSDWDAAIALMQSKLAEVDAEPVARAFEGGQNDPRRMHPEMKKLWEDYFDKAYKQLQPIVRPWVGLTRQETTELGLANLRYLEEDYDTSGIYDFTQAIEAKLKEKNT
jgi:hypothetical protein